MGKVGAFERRNSIMKLLSSKSVYTVAEICISLNMTESTARRDILHLEKLNKLKRFHGGVILNNNQLDEYAVREQKYPEEKKRIGEYGAKLVENGDLIYIGGGTTNFQLAKSLANRNDLHHVSIVTATLSIAQALEGNSDYRLIVLGGVLKSFDDTMVSSFTIAELSAFNFSKAFEGIQGVSSRFGFSMPSMELSVIDRILSKNSKAVYILADHSKFGVIGSYRAFEIDNIQFMVTDSHETVKDEIRGSKEFETKTIFV